MKSFVVGLMLTASPLAMTAASAQDAENFPITGGTTWLERIIVGAGHDKVAVDTPQAVTVLDQNDLDQAQATTVGEVFDQVPGVTAIGSDRIVGQSFNIRGVGALGASDESKIIVSIDGATKFYEQYRMGSLFTDPELYKSVEILRGPASSTLYGSGAYGGVINLTTKDASDFIKHEGQMGVVRLKGTYDSNQKGYLGSLIFATKLGANTDFLATGNYRRADDYDDGDGNTIAGSNFISWSGLFKGTHRFGAGNEQVVRLSYQRWQSDLDDTEYSQTGTLGFGSVDRKTTDHNAVFSYENPAANNPWIDVKFNLSYSDTTVIQDDAQFGPGTSIFQDSDYGYKTISGKLENTFEAKGAGFENFLTMGAQYSHQTRTAETAVTLGFHPEGIDQKIGFYVQNEFVWNDALTLIPGARVDFVNLEPDAGIAGASETKATLFSPKLAALYKLTDHFSVFGSYAHTQRTPTLDEMFSTDNRFGRDRRVSLQLENETSNNYEVGFAIKGDNILRSNDKFRLKTTFFRNDLKDLITTPSPQGTFGNPQPYYVNVDSAFLQGVEVEASYDAETHFARVAYSAIRGEDESTGQRLSTVPSDNLYVTLGARVPNQDLEFGWTALFAKSINTGASSSLDYAGYGVHGIYMSWKPEGFEVRASVDNLFDKDYRSNLAGDDGKGRAFKLTLAKDFNF